MHDIIIHYQIPRSKTPSPFAFNNATSNKKIPSLKSSATTKSATDTITLKNNSNNHYHLSSKSFDKINIQIISELLIQPNIAISDLSKTWHTSFYNSKKKSHTK